MEPAEPVDDGGDRDWNALLERVLAPFRSEAAAFHVLLAVLAIFAVLVAVVLVARALT
jgi:hypothetical protein